MTLLPSAIPAPILLRTFALLAALMWTSLVFGGEIHDAVRKGDLNTVKALLKDHPDWVFSKDDDDWPPLNIAALAGNTDVVALLLANKADVNAMTRQGSTPLHLAVRKDHLEMAELLLANKADVNALGDIGEPPLIDAVINGNTHMAKLLLTHGAGVNTASKNGLTPLAWAVLVRNTDMARLLLTAKATLDFKDNRDKTLLYLAAGMGNKDMVELFLARGADVNAPDRDGRTPLHAAAYGGHTDVVELLRRHGGHDAPPAITSVAMTDAAHDDDLATVRQLLQDNPNLVSSKDDISGDTPLHWAAANDDLPMAQLLVADKAGINARNNHGDTPLHNATINGHKDIAALLRQQGGHE